MTVCDRSHPRPILLMVAGAKGAVASTIATAVAALDTEPEAVFPFLTTAQRFAYLGPAENVQMAGWDLQGGRLSAAVERHGVLPEHLWASRRGAIDSIPVKEAPAPEMDLSDQVQQVSRDIQAFLSAHPAALPVLVNLLPACDTAGTEQCRDAASVDEALGRRGFPDLAYVLAAVRAGVPVVNFTPNAVEIPMVLAESLNCAVPIAGRDGKTGQTYFKVVLASAFKARSLGVDGWYSLNILGNADGKNLMDPHRAAGKVANKTQLLDDVLGYPVGRRYAEPAHKVHIDYYPPRGDAKEAWDVIDFRGLFDLPMSLRVDLQGRDSILAAPMVLDLARWVTALHLAGFAGPVPELAFYFKRPVGDDAPLNFQAQAAALEKLDAICAEKMAAMLNPDGDRR